MAKSIYPGNYVNRLSSYQGQPVIALPGRVQQPVEPGDKEPLG